MITQTKTQLEPLLLDPDGPRVAAIGGGHGLAITLEAVQSYASQITAVVAVADDGGSSGRLTSGLGIPPPGDIRRCLLALTLEPSMWSEMFAYRFRGGDIEDHSLGNLLLAALTDLYGDFAAAVDEAGRLLGAVGRVVPAATVPAVLTAIIGGQRVEGQVAVMEAKGRIEKLEIGPEGIAANPAAIAAIETADQIVLGPGSLFTSLMAALLVPGIAESVMTSRAKKVFLLNLVTQEAETLGLSGRDHIGALALMAGLQGPGTVITHRGYLEVPEDHDLVGLDGEEAAEWGWHLLEEDIADVAAEWPAHDPVKLARVLEMAYQE